MSKGEVYWHIDSAEDIVLQAKRLLARDRDDERRTIAHEILSETETLKPFLQRLVLLQLENYDRTASWWNGSQLALYWDHWLRSEEAGQSRWLRPLVRKRLPALAPEACEVVADTSKALEQHFEIEASTEPLPDKHGVPIYLLPRDFLAKLGKEVK